MNPTHKCEVGLAIPGSFQLDLLRIWSPLPTVTELKSWQDFILDFRVVFSSHTSSTLNIAVLYELHEIVIEHSQL